MGALFGRLHASRARDPYIASLRPPKFGIMQTSLMQGRLEKHLGAVAQHGVFGMPQDGRGGGGGGEGVTKVAQPVTTMSAALPDVLMPPSQKSVYRVNATTSNTGFAVVPKTSEVANTRIWKAVGQISPV